MGAQSLVYPSTLSRVLGAGKRLTGYAAGVEKKVWLLEHEGADFKDIK